MAEFINEIMANDWIYWVIILVLILKNKGNTTINLNLEYNPISSISKKDVIDVDSYK